ELAVADRQGVIVEPVDSAKGLFLLGAGFDVDSGVLDVVGQQRFLVLLPRRYGFQHGLKRRARWRLGAVANWPGKVARGANWPETETNRAVHRVRHRTEIVQRIIRKAS